MASAAVVTFATSLSEDLQDKAEAELNEKREWRDRDIQAIRDMVLANNALKSCTDSGFLLRFLRARKFDYDRAYALIVNYYTMRATNIDVFKTMLPSDPKVEKVFNSGVVSLLPERDSTGRAIMYFRPGKWNPEEFSIFDILRANVLTLELAITEEDTQVNGVVLIGNLSDTGFVHLRNIDRAYAKMMTNVLQEAFPLRFKGINFVNESIIFGAVFALMKPFLKEKTVQRLNFHGASLDSLHKIFDPSILPQELGGKLATGDVLAQEWKARVLAHEPVYKEMAEKYKITVVSDNLGKNSVVGQIGSSVDATSDCIVGSYRKLNVD